MTLDPPPTSKTDKNSSNRSNNREKGDGFRNNNKVGAKSQPRCRCSASCGCPNAIVNSTPAAPSPPPMISPSPSPPPPITIIDVEPRIPERKQLSFTAGPVNDDQPSPPNVVTELASPKRKCSCSKRRRGRPCADQNECACVRDDGDADAQTMRSRIHDLDSVLKAHGKGKKRRSKNIQTKSVQISQVFKDPETNKKNLVTLTERSRVKVHIKTFCDDTRQLEKQKNRRPQRTRSRSSQSSSSINSVGGRKKRRSVTKLETKPKTEPKKDKASKTRVNKPARKKKRRGGCCRGCCGRVDESSTTSISTRDSQYRCPNNQAKHTAKQSVSCIRGDGQSSFDWDFLDDPATVKQTSSPLGLKTYSKTTKGADGIVNTNTIVFPENFSSGCECKQLAAQIDKHVKEIEDIRRSVGECLQILKIGKAVDQNVYMLSDVSRSPLIPTRNYCNLYTRPDGMAKSKKLKSSKCCELLPVEANYSKVSDWISEQEQHQSVKDVKDQLNASKRSKKPEHAARGTNCVDEFTLYPPVSYQIYRSKRSRSRSVERTASLDTVASTSKCDRIKSDCKCSAACIGNEGSNSTVGSRTSDDSRRKESRGSNTHGRCRSRCGHGDNVSSVSSYRYDLMPNANNQLIVTHKRKKRSSCWRNFLRCTLCFG